MKIYFYIMLFIIIPTCSFAQSRDLTVGSNGKVIPGTSDTKVPSKPKDVVDYFYSQIQGIKKLDGIISFRFYQKTPYNKFKELLLQINNTTGKLLTKEIIKTEYSTEKNSVMFTIKAIYEKVKTYEILYLIQESPGIRFEVYEYQLKKDN